MRNYAQLEAHVVLDRDDERQQGEPEQDNVSGIDIDWELLRAANPDVAAWLTVDGAPINLPVVAQREGDADGFYLHHDLWREESTLGCPYLDRRCDAASPHLLAYGHHIAWSDAVFSSLFEAWRPGGLDGVGTATWRTPDGTAQAFEPAFALKVEENYGDIQRFSFGDVDVADVPGNEMTLRAWLGKLSAQATEHAAGEAILRANATRALTLVTCASTVSNQRERTLVVFVSVECEDCILRNASAQ